MNLLTGTTNGTARGRIAFKLSSNYSEINPAEGPNCRDAETSRTNSRRVRPLDEFAIRPPIYLQGNRPRLQKFSGRAINFPLARLVLLAEHLNVGFAVGIEEIFAALLPGRPKVRCGDVPVRPAFPSDRT